MKTKVTRGTDRREEITVVEEPKFTIEIGVRTAFYLLAAIGSTSCDVHGVDYFDGEGVYNSLYDAVERAVGVAEFRRRLRGHEAIDRTYRESGADAARLIAKSHGLG